MDHPIDITDLVRERQDQLIARGLDRLEYRWSELVPTTTPCAMCGCTLAYHALLDPAPCGACLCPGFRVAL